MNKRHYIIPIFVPHEGCPHNCVFCNQDSITGSRTTVNHVFVEETVKEYLKYMETENSIIELSFFGGTFTAINKDKQRELLEVAKYFKDLGKINYIRLSTRPDYIDDEILTLLNTYSVDIIELGVQSLDKEVLTKSARGHSEEDVIKASKLIKEYGFTLGHQIMLGLPGDTFSKDIETVEKIIGLKPDICRIYPSLVIKNTPMELMYRKGSYRPYSLEEALDISKTLYGMLVSNGINVIRVGLQPTEEINFGKEIVDGPFHPSFGELLEGSLINDMIFETARREALNEFVIRINSRDLSKLYANKKKFFNDNKKQLNTKNILVLQDNNVSRNNVVLESNNECRTLSIYEYLEQKYNKGNSFDL